MRADYLIVGQGLCGTLLSWYLLAEGKQVVVVDEERPATATRVASGVINPVTGRRLVRTWLIDQLMPAALEAYALLGQELQTPLVRSCNILEFHATDDAQAAFEGRIPEGEDYLHAINNERQWEPYFRFGHGIGEIDPGWLIDLHRLLDGWRARLLESGALVAAPFRWDALNTERDGVSWEGITAEKIIFCDGAAGHDHTLFRLLPYARNKGEAIIAAIPGLPRNHTYRHGLSMVPWGGADRFWIGSTYDWHFTDLQPSPEFRRRVTGVLDSWLRLPYTLMDHLAAERPANMDRRPFVGLHPVYPNIGILNGMGTKGCSMAPFFARQLARHLVHGEPLMPEADVRRFTKVLSRA